MRLSSEFPFFQRSGPAPAPAPSAGPAPASGPPQPAVQTDVSAILASAFAERDAAKNSLTTISANLLVAEDRVKTLTTKAEGLETQVTALTTERNTLQTRVTELEAEAKKTTGEIRQDVRNKELSTLAASQGVVPGGVPPTTTEANGPAQITPEMSSIERAQLRLKQLGL